MKKKKAIGYLVRILDCNGNQVNLSLEKQFEEIVKYCDLKGYELDDIHNETIKATNSIKRVGLERVLENSNNYDLIISYDIGSIARNIFEVSELFSRLEEIDLMYSSATEGLFRTDTPSGRLCVNMLESLVRLEEDLKVKYQT
ncbi:recombinase family protein [Evansella halocellulosilytica]|uniref:recombinase family protein n=1 Tax=Evansella halocellulosilytica TaxID=2011013 RepID=UPI000BB68FB4|nr:recombinase family protein [Evansella halocellulosilytica]